MAGTVQDITDRKRAEDEIVRSHEALRNLAARMEAVREEERAALARELHDELGQALTALHLDASWIERHLRRDQRAQACKVADMKEVVHGALQTVRRLSTELRPAMLDDIGLYATIEAEAARFSGRSGLRCALDLAKEPIVRLPAKAPVFRVLQEALTNIARHAAATSVMITWRVEGDRAVLTVRDDGAGISVTALDDPRALGIVGMRERALAIGARLDIAGEPGRGTTVTLSVPLSSNAE